MKNFVAFGTIGAIAASSSFGQCVPVRSYVDIIPAEGAVVTNQVGVAAALAGSFNLGHLPRPMHRHAISHLPHWSVHGGHADKSLASR